MMESSILFTAMHFSLSVANFMNYVSFRRSFRQHSALLSLNVYRGIVSPTLTQLEANNISF